MLWSHQVIRFLKTEKVMAGQIRNPTLLFLLFPLKATANANMYLHPVLIFHLVRETKNVQ